ncbi:MAG: hypothetical protein R6U32_06435 [Candidatus Woesearchaeota archaeon]
MAKLRCGNCNYVFEPKSGKPNRCPYCAATGRMFEERSIIDQQLGDE